MEVEEIAKGDEPLKWKKPLKWKQKKFLIWKVEGTFIMESRRNL